MPYKNRVAVRVMVPPGIVDRMYLLLALSGEAKSAYATRVLTEAIERDLARFPVHVAWLRPGATVFRRTGDGFTPICRVPGGERAWPISIVGLPASMSPARLGWEVDVTSTEGGYEGRNVIVPVEDIVGSRAEAVRLRLAEPARPESDPRPSRAQDPSAGQQTAWLGKPLNTPPAVRK